MPLVVGQRLVRETEWLQFLKTFGISAEDGKKIIHRLGGTLLSEHENLFGTTDFGPPSISLLHLLGKGLSVRAFQSPRGGASLG